MCVCVCVWEGVRWKMALEHNAGPRYEQTLNRSMNTTKRSLKAPPLPGDAAYHLMCVLSPSLRALSLPFSLPPSPAPSLPLSLSHQLLAPCSL